MIYVKLPIRLGIWLLCLSLPLFGAVVADQSDLKIETPSLQKRSDRKIRLDNGLEALLISDPETPSSGAALAVSVGSWDDPLERPGMAHFVEHLLFLGTEKYPEEEGYTRYLDEHGGVRNAFTMADRTCYIFSVNNEGFSEALDRFGHFFIAPLFSKSGVERECKAIHQEYCKDIPLDPWRTLYVKKEIANPKHPFHAFCIGNLDTLGRIHHDEVKNWYYANYSADRMHLVVVSQKTLDELQAEVTTLFSKVERKNGKQSLVAEPIFTEEAKGTLTAVYPIQAVQQLELCWEIPRELLQNREMHIEKLVAHVLGHEGETSLLAQLKREHLAEGLGIGMHHAGQNQGFLSLSVALTAAGIRNYEKVISCVHEALAGLRQSNIPRYIFDEVVKLEEMHYRFQSREEVFNFVSDFATAMIDEPLETFPRKSLIPTTYSREKISDFLTELRPENAVYTLIAQEEFNPFKADRKEAWLGAVYSLRMLPEKQLAIWQNAKPNEEVTLPGANPFIPENLHCHATPIHSDHLPQPHLVVDTDKAKIYSCADDRFCVPHVAWHFAFSSPEVKEGDAKSQVLADLYCHAVSQKLNPIAYNALIAGLDCSIDSTGKGVLLSIEGYSDKAPAFLATILEAMQNSLPTKEQFLLYKELAKRDYANQAQTSTLRLGLEILGDMLYAEHTTAVKKCEAIEHIRYSDLVRFSNDLWKKSFCEATLFGNQTESQSSEVAGLINQNFPGKGYPLSSHPKKRVASLPDTSLFVEKSSMPSNALILAMDMGEFSFEKRAAQEILSKGLEEPFFSELRTKQQTAYLVSNWSQEIERRLYTFFAIQSSTHETRDLLARFELFLETSVQDLSSKTIPESRFEAIRQACIEKLEKPAENMVKMGAILHLLATDYDGDFTWLDQRKVALEKLTYEQFLDYSEQFLGKGNKRRLAICVDGELPENQRFRYSPIQTFDNFRKRIEYQSR